MKIKSLILLIALILFANSIERKRKANASKSKTRSKTSEDTVYARLCCNVLNALRPGKYLLDIGSSNLRPSPYAASFEDDESEKSILDKFKEKDLKNTFMDKCKSTGKSAIEFTDQWGGFDCCDTTDAPDTMFVEMNFMMIGSMGLNQCKFD